MADFAPDARLIMSISSLYCRVKYGWNLGRYARRVLSPLRNTRLAIGPLCENMIDVIHKTERTQEVHAPSSENRAACTKIW